MHYLAINLLHTLPLNLVFLPRKWVQSSIVFQLGLADDTFNLYQLLCISCSRSQWRVIAHNSRGQCQELLNKPNQWLDNLQPHPWPSTSPREHQQSSRYPGNLTKFLVCLEMKFRFSVKTTSIPLAPPHFSVHRNNELALQYAEVNKVSNLVRITNSWQCISHSVVLYPALVKQQHCSRGDWQVRIMTSSSCWEFTLYGFLNLEKKNKKDQRGTSKRDTSSVCCPDVAKQSFSKQTLKLNLLCRLLPQISQDTSLPSKALTLIQLKKDAS